MHGGDAVECIGRSSLSEYMGEMLLNAWERCCLSARGRCCLSAWGRCYLSVRGRSSLFECMGHS